MAQTKRSKNEVTEETKTHFLSFICKPENNDCWLWNGYVGKGGYGQFRLNGKKLNASRASYMLFRGDANNQVVCHTCDNRQCVNPSHLWLGSQSDNLRDAVRKGKWPLAKLNQVKVDEIKRKYRTGEYKIIDLATTYGVSRSNVEYIIRGLTWKTGNTDSD